LDRIAPWIATINLIARNQDCKFQDIIQSPEIYPGLLKSLYPQLGDLTRQSNIFRHPRQYPSQFNPPKSTAIYWKLFPASGQSFPLVPESYDTHATKPNSIPAGKSIPAAASS
jgi:hypothetical protein